MNTTEILRWVISISTLVGGIATALEQIPQLTWAAALPAVLLVISGWVQRARPWDQPKASSIYLDDLDPVTREVAERQRAQR